MVEDVLVLVEGCKDKEVVVCLNPCCGGRCSSTKRGMFKEEMERQS